MDKGELFNFEDKSLLDDAEVKYFASGNIWPAAIYFWGTDFRNPLELEENEDVYVPFETPDGEGMVVISFYLQNDYEPQDTDEYDDEEDDKAELSVYVSMEVLRNDLIDILPRRSRGLKVWEVLSYRFPVNGGEPSANHYYILEKKNGDEVKNMTDEQEEFIDRIEGLDRFSLDREPWLTTQDCIDIHNMLLALEVPEGIISLPE